MIELFTSRFAAIAVNLSPKIGPFYIYLRLETSPDGGSGVAFQPRTPDAYQRKEEPTSEETEVEKISRRFRTVLDLMNEDRYGPKFNVPQLADIMKLDKVSKLENIFIGKKEPALQFMDRFCDAFGVNKTWLLEGKRSPFSNDYHPEAEPLLCFEDIQHFEPQYIYFIRENTDTAPAFIVLQLSDWKYKILHRTWHISDHVGAGGEAALLSFYYLVNKLRDEGCYSKCRGRTLEKDDFRALLHGKKFPGKFTETTGPGAHWWDDLTDIDHRYPIAVHYPGMYGDSYIKAQGIIKQKLKGH